LGHASPLKLLREERGLMVVALVALVGHMRHVLDHDM
jgi:hypothetical protein